jgi:SAM-dependent methyltransferase
MIKLIRKLNRFLSNRRGTLGERQPESRETPDILDVELNQLAFQLILNGKVDPSEFNLWQERAGFPHFKNSASKMNRDEFILTLVQSEEFERKHNLPPLHEFFMDRTTVGSSEVFAPFVKKVPLGDVQLNELTNPMKWIDPKWRQIGQTLQVVPMSLGRMHRKSFEWVQTLYGLDLLGMLQDDLEALGVGTGHECIVYWLANKLKKVYATDLFEGEWCRAGAMEGDPSVLENPEKYQPFEYRNERLKFLRMDGRNLLFQSNSFDIVFSLSSIEHFGGKDSAARAMEEMGRVLKPGGIAVIATEFILNGKEHSEFFTEKDLLEYVVKPSGMQLIQNIGFTIPRVFLKNPIKFPSDIYKTPHLSLTIGDIIFTSIILFFEKG